MLITRTESYTDWSYQGALAGETAAWNGVGLYEGSIYFRHSHDTLKPGERILREEFFVELSDGSTYPLGEGASREKITITNHGTTSDGSVYLEVKGNPAYGVGVSRVTQNITVEFDDGRVPVLDTDQLTEILGNLRDSLTQSMQDTANAVKQEAFARVDTMGIELKDTCNSTVSAAKADVESKVTALDGRFESNKTDVSRQMFTLDSRLTNTANALDAKIGSVQTNVSIAADELRGELQAGVQAVSQECDTKTDAVKSELSSAISTTERKCLEVTKQLESSVDSRIAQLEAFNGSIEGVIQSRIAVCRWALPVRSVGGGGSSSVNLLMTAPLNTFGSSAFTYDSTNQSVVVKGSGVFNVPRVIRIELSMHLTASSDFNDDISFQLTGTSGNILAQQFFHLDYARYGASGGPIPFVQLGGHLYIGADTTGNVHEIAKKGIQIRLLNHGTGDVTLNQGSSIVMVLT